MQKEVKAEGGRIYLSFHKTLKWIAVVLEASTQHSPTAKLHHKVSQVLSIRRAIPRLTVVAHFPCY